MSIPAQPSDPLFRRGEIARGAFSYTDEGDGPVIVAVPGYPGGPRDFRWLAPALGGKARLIRLAMPGFGETPLETGPETTLAGRAAFVAAVLEALDLENVLLLGHSMGGAIAGHAAHLAPARVAGLALVCSIGPLPHPTVRGRRMQVGAALARRPLCGAPIRAMLPRLFAQLGFPPVWTLPQLLHTLDCAAALDFPAWANVISQLSLPTAVLWAEDDAIIPPAISRALADAAPQGPRIAFATGGHNIQKHHACELAEVLRGLVVQTAGEGEPDSPASSS